MQLTASAIVMLGEPVGWESALQLLVDVLLTSGGACRVPCAVGVCFQGLFRPLPFRYGQLQARTGQLSGANPCDRVQRGPGVDGRAIRAAPVRLL